MAFVPLSACGSDIMSLLNGSSPSANLQQAVAALTAAAVDENQAIAIQLSRDSLAELKRGTACAQVINGVKIPCNMQLMQ